MQMDRADSQITLALVSFTSLGDSLIYLMMAENLRLNGYQVELYGDVPYALRKWVPQLSIRPAPDYENLDRELAAYTLSFVCPPPSVRSVLAGELLRDWRERYLLICHRAPESWQFDHRSRLKPLLPEEAFDAVAPLLSGSGPIRYRKFQDESVVEITLAYMRERLGLKTVTKQVALTPPTGMELRRYKNRVVVSPDSAGPPKKEWSPRSFLHLCDRLRAQGFEPSIVVAPNNHAHWFSLSAGRYLTPKLSGIDELAGYIYESAAVISNDSGNGHLASFLGVPVVTIYRKRNAKFHWRPDWRSASVVCPTLTLPGLNGRIWQPFVSVKSVLQALERCCD